MTTARARQGSGSGQDLPSLDGPRLRAIPAGREHVQQIQSCFLGAPDYFARTEGGPPGAHAAEQLVSEAEADDTRRVYALVPHTGGPAVGVLDLYLHHPEPGTAHIGLLLFREACQGLGYGKETTAALEHALVRAGFSTLRLSIGDENPGAKAFWERLGFAEVGRLERGVGIYEKRLE
ncbi:GNAT family N-acetyltransferase [Anaeromyxobacter oryzae]|uniref:N-acetyltransferase n=1 Tax=Anaeromyxobacter oryzae TaxID=2918170 RepID=A0ABN6MWY5_9BACT|nr:GNAT family N-acetyltransferase [Anaeromyxobacter oryzae]BDG04327.1 N-acetyltransferase [Anaeromyxobacter oryzae]